MSRTQRGLRKAGASPAPTTKGCSPTSGKGSSIGAGLAPAFGRASRHIFLRLLLLALPVKNWMILAALLGSLTVASGIGLAATSAYLISAAALHPSIAALQIAIVGVRFFGITRGIFRYLERLVSHKATFRLLANLRVWFYNALEPLLPARIITDTQGIEGQGPVGPGRGQAPPLRSGDLLRRAVADIDLLQNFYIRIVAPPVVAAIIGLTMWIFLGAFGAAFGLTFILFFLLASIGVPLLTHLLSQRVGAEIVETRAELHAQLVDSVQGIADLIAFGQEQRQAEQIQRLNKRLTHLQMVMAQISGMQSGLTNLLMNVMTWTMLLVAIPIIRAGNLNPIFLALLVLATIASFEIVLPLAGAFQQIGASLEAARRLFEIVDAEPSIHEPSNPSPAPQDHSIGIENLHFRYSNTEPEILQDITFTLPEKHFIAIVGPSGSGKSTLIHLLLRYWDYHQGQIKLGGHELRDYKQDDLYKLVSVIEQDTHLFNTSIRENLMLARPEATHAEMEEAARLAQIHDFVLALPRGYDTQVGEQGLRLSGGERQRIAIARAFLKDAPILLLDEPTVNLDAIAERGVLQALRNLASERTTIMVTHRLIKLDTADEILVLQAGKIVERGKHAELLQTEGMYWRMWKQQQSHDTQVSN
jgi:ATP-binding cassette, subfamily C, bacterial CydC